MSSVNSNVNPGNPESIHIITASVTGTALKVSRYLKQELAPRLNIKLHEYPDLNEIIVEPKQLLLFCVSNTGAGELPPRMRKVWVQLTEQNRDLTGHQYLIVNFGDRSYREYGLSGKILDSALKKCGAKRLSPRLTIDALVAPEPEEPVSKWLFQELEKHQLLPSASR